jgi:hypothetical protein
VQPSIFHILSSQDHCAACFTCLLHQWFFSLESSGLQSNGHGLPKEGSRGCEGAGPTGMDACVGQIGKV